jgi:hypothetical protein
MVCSKKKKKKIQQKHAPLLSTPLSFALSFVKLDGDFSHLLIYHKDEGWETENVQGTYSTLYELLQHMQHFVNLVDSPQLVPDEHHSNAQRKFVTFLVEKHEFLGILFYRHSFSGLRLFRRVLLHTLIFLLLIGTNLIAYSVVDADCVKKAYCNAQCVEAHGAEQCAAPRSALQRHQRESLARHAVRESALCLPAARRRLARRPARLRVLRQHSQSALGALGRLRAHVHR